MKRVIVIFLFIVSLLLISCNNSTNFPLKSQTISRSNPSMLNSTINIAVDDIEFDELIITDDLVKMGGQPVRSVSNTILATHKDAVDGELLINHDYLYYGIHNLTYKLSNKGKIVKEYSEEKIITADEYNIAGFSATMPVTDFTLMALNKDYVTPYFNSSVPTILVLERAWSYSWNNLPENILINPFIIDEVIIEGANNNNYHEYFHNNYDYVAYLYSLNNNSKFNFLINDYWPNQFIDYIEIGIPIDQMKFVFISDGTATFNVFKDAYREMTAENDNSLLIYDEIKNDWITFKKAIIDNRNNASNALKASNRSYIRDFIQPMLSDEDFDVYWVVNNNSDNNYGGLRAFKEIIKVNSHFIKLDMNALLNDLNEKEKQSLKMLYAFDNSELTKALGEGKQPVIFLGTSTSNEQHLSIFCKIMKNLLGDNYAVLYKGHPGHITNGAETREKILKENGYIMLDASIPAELVAFFNPDCDLAGYPTSTFLTVDKKIPFMCFNKYDASYINNVCNYAEVLGDGSFRIVKDRQNNPKYTVWNGFDDWNSLIWIDGDPNV